MFITESWQPIREQDVCSKTYWWIIALAGLRFSWGQYRNPGLTTVLINQELIRTLMLADHLWLSLFSFGFKWWSLNLKRIYSFYKTINRTLRIFLCLWFGNSREKLNVQSCRRCKYLHVCFTTTYTPTHSLTHTGLCNSVQLTPTAAGRKLQMFYSNTHLSFYTFEDPDWHDEFLTTLDPKHDSDLNRKTKSEPSNSPVKLCGLA